MLRAGGFVAETTQQIGNYFSNNWSKYCKLLIEQQQQPQNTLVLYTAQCHFYWPFEALSHTRKRTTLMAWTDKDKHCNMCSHKNSFRIKHELHKYFL